jgi:nucleoid-associated protein YgaU
MPDESAPETPANPPAPAAPAQAAPTSAAPSAQAPPAAPSAAAPAAPAVSAPATPPAAAAASPAAAGAATAVAEPEVPKVKPKKSTQRACDEKDAKGKLCCGHLKRFYDYPKEIEALVGAKTEVYRCEFCKTLYTPDRSQPPHSYTLRY